MIGVNLYAGQLNSGGAYGKDYIYPALSYLDYYASKGMDLIRLPFDWERLQPTKNGPLSATELSRIDPIIDHARALGVQVVLDPHNYGYGYGKMIGGTGTGATTNA